MSPPEVLNWTEHFLFGHPGSESNGVLSSLENFISVIFRKISFDYETDFTVSIINVNIINYRSTGNISYPNFREYSLK